MDSVNTQVTKETKKKIRVNYEGKLSGKERLSYKLKSSKTWISLAVKLFKFILMLGVSFVILHPFIAQIAGSFMSASDVADVTVAVIPKNFTLNQYVAIATETEYFDSLINTAIISLACALIQTFISCLIGYGLAKFKFKGNNLIMLCVVFTMIIPPAALKFSLQTHFENFDFLKLAVFDYRGIFDILSGGKQMDLTGTFWPFIIISLFGLAFKNGLYIYLMRQFFKGIPDELEESAYVDGSGTFRTFFRIILPLTVPMLITVFLFSFSWQWTDTFYSTVFDLYDEMTFAPDILSELANELYIPESLTEGQFIADMKSYTLVLRYTFAIMFLFPLVIVYLFFQKYLVQGIERSGITG